MYAYRTQILGIYCDNEHSAVSFARLALSSSSFFRSAAGEFLMYQPTAANAADTAMIERITPVIRLIFSF